MWQLQGQRTQLCKNYLDRWGEAGIDGILCKCISFGNKTNVLISYPSGPTMPFATVEHGKFKHVGYTVSLSGSCVARETTDS